MNNNIIFGDCLEKMKDIPDCSIDACITDPPFGQTKNEWDKVIDYEQMWNELKRIVKPNGVIALFADGIFLADLMVSNRKMWRYNLIWDKQLTTGFLNANRMPLRKHETICIFYQKLPTYNPQFTEGKPSHSRGKLKSDFKNNIYGEFKQVNTKEKSTQKYPTSILSIAKVHPSKTIHPTEKPIEVMEYLIKMYTNEGDTVLDFACGCGSTGVACINTNRNFIGIEKEKDFYLIAEKRTNG